MSRMDKRQIISGQHVQQIGQEAREETAQQIIGAFLMHLGQAPWEAEELLAWLDRGGFEILRRAGK